MPHCARHRRWRDHAVVDAMRKRRNVRLQMSKGLSIPDQRSVPAETGQQKTPDYLQ